ncbi:MAG: hypothetical protein ACFE94_15415 [Candidatus Hodarchaeota archaeon]
MEEKTYLVPQKYNRNQIQIKFSKLNMTETQLFNLEKIKDLTSSIDEIQAKIFQLNEDSEKVKTFKQSIIYIFTDKVFLSQINEITHLMNDLKDILEDISKDNINIFLSLQESLIKKYKEKKQEKLKKLKLNQENLREIGLYLIERKKINKTIHEISYVPSIEVVQWLEILDSLKQNSLFLKTIKKIEIYYYSLIQDRLKLELSKIPEDTDISLIKDFEATFLENPNISFSEFLQDFESKLTQKELKTKKEFIAKVKEREELEKLKKKQEEQKEAYNDYLKLSDKAFERKIRKKAREKLSDIRTTDKKPKKIEISDEVSEKIEKFKSKLDKSFAEKYFIQKDDEKDPLDLIRERKIKKEKEYKKYKDHFEEI